MQLKIWLQLKEPEAFCLVGESQSLLNKMASLSPVRLSENFYFLEVKSIFVFLWFLCRIVDPLLFGDYPEIMKKIAGTRIPAFTKSESKQVKGSIDFLGLNHYVTFYVKDNPSSLEKDNRDIVQIWLLRQYVCYYA